MVEDRCDCGVAAVADACPCVDVSALRCLEGVFLFLFDDTPAIAAAFSRAPPLLWVPHLVRGMRPPSAMSDAETEVRTLQHKTVRERLTVTSLRTHQAQAHPTASPYIFLHVFEAVGRNGIRTQKMNKESCLNAAPLVVL
eukprot:m.153642 g.153642  ORF g.153642 m.153642 type:complete len:140 (-) comp14351_c0_seq7:270-689(-)